MDIDMTEDDARIEILREELDSMRAMVRKLSYKEAVYHSALTTLKRHTENVMGGSRNLSATYRIVTEALEKGGEDAS